VLLPSLTCFISTPNHISTTGEQKIKQNEHDPMKECNGPSSLRKKVPKKKVDEVNAIIGRYEDSGVLKSLTHVTFNFHLPT